MKKKILSDNKDKGKKEKLQPYNKPRISKIVPIETRTGSQIPSPY